MSTDSVRQPNPGHMHATVTGLASAWHAAVVALVIVLGCTAPSRAVDVLTYHNNNFRTGLDNLESVLTPTTVGSSAFKLLKTVTLQDEQIDAQPLVISAATIASRWPQNNYPNDVVFVATELNNIYAIDGSTGAIILSKNFGTPVSSNNLPGKCGNNFTNVGITSTPVIDIIAGVMYAMTYTREDNAAVYRLHEIKLTDLSEPVPSQIVAATRTLSDGTVVRFQATYQRQRPSLLLANGVIYAGFGSFCDYSNVSRGWLMGWSAGTLTPLRVTGLVNQETAAESPTQVYLSSIWMSGYGISADSSGYLYFSTSNSNEVHLNNYPESAMKVTPDLRTAVDFFTPGDFGVLDAEDGDFGSGGLMVVPDQPGGLQFAVGGGKDGRLFLLNRNNMGKVVPGGPDRPTSVAAGQCWCGPSYFVGSDGKPRIVSSGAWTPATWLLPTTATGPLSFEAAGPQMPISGQDPGFMTSVSSNGVETNTAIIWAVSRSVDNVVYLEAYSATAQGGVLASLFGSTAMPAGPWGSPGNNASLVPTVANGHVYVASLGTLSIFGLVP